MKHAANKEQGTGAVERKPASRQMSDNKYCDASANRNIPTAQSEQNLHKAFALALSSALLVSTQVEIARRLKVTQQAISLWAKGGHPGHSEIQNRIAALREIARKGAA